MRASISIAYCFSIGSAFALPLISSPTIDGNPGLDRHAFGTRWDEPLTNYARPGGTPSLTNSLLLPQTAKIAGLSGGSRAGQMEKKRLQKYADSLGQPESRLKNPEHHGHQGHAQQKEHHGNGENHQKAEKASKEATSNSRVEFGGAGRWGLGPFSHKQGAYFDEPRIVHGK
ncbi:hypothetical protein IE81DRAFT_4894 [Ceraceosorus guamensis]|uniref:Secreted protein n=1 Tax=Ceraceosorus guamensis TaxID=1522189 RepID=A0A316W923_9BASI|nr:hypothetical protein IE81DRAFT_4894 [Ceraceosorus guamensis]PWN46332.1 hypothetical protein IE81DRAFT_4894 [Ceraceosorus guamensis]